MISNERGSTSAAPPAEAARPRAPDAFLARLQKHAPTGTFLKLRPHQRIVLGSPADDTVFVVQSGILATQAVAADSDPRCLALHFRCDTAGGPAIPALPERVLVAAVPAEVLRLSSSALVQMIATDPELAACYKAVRDRQLVRSSLHAMALACLDGPQRFVGYLFDLALETGVPSGGGVQIHLPLSRTETAGYLALNADTLSRLMSRLKSDGLLTQTSRHEITLRDLDLIARLCPLASAIRAVPRARVPVSP